MEHKVQRFFKILMLILLTSLITFIITTIFVYKSTNGFNEKFASSDKTSLSSRIAYYKQFIDQHYIYDTDESKMEDSAIKGYFEGLDDEYSKYITNDEMKEYMADAKGKYVGIGIYIANNIKTNQIVVIAPIKDSPAEEAGLKPGDVILKIDDIEYTGEQLSEASEKLKDKEGTFAKVTVLREKETLEFEVERKTIRVNHIESKIVNDNIGYIQISSFDEECYEDFKKNYEELKEKNIKSLIIDLRDNGGGIVIESTKIADMFVEKDAPLLITKSKKKDEEITKSETEKEIDLPIVILINGNTASASEILTAAIKENVENTTIVGETSYGKGVIQSIFTLKDGSGIKLTTEEYFSPKHNSINKVGIKPDYEVKLPEGKTIYTIEDDKDDTQLQKAIEILK